MVMPGRKYQAATGLYRYGFNGKENDNDVKGEGNQQDYGMRIYDPRLGRFLSVDPIAERYPMLTPYQFASNRPVDGVDLDGLEYLTYTLVYQKNGNSPATLSNSSIVWHNSQEHNAHGSLGRGVMYDIKLYDSKTKTYQQFDHFFVPRNGELLGGRFHKDYGNYMGPTSLFKYGSGNNLKDGGRMSSEPDYSIPAVDAVDEAAKMHDKRYDKIGAVGQQSLVNDFGTTPIDIQALKSWEGIIYNNTHPEVNEKGRIAAIDGAILFSGLATYKQGLISKFMKKNYSKEASSDVSKNYDLFLKKYMHKDSEGDWRRNDEMWNKKENEGGTSTYSPIAPKK